mmetsp:Transcript_61375/g.155001  ORF Transcript_61375/g.155001 Transcript_61375/m.155001 type:complete len:214 (-) Transcript_61375:216-857(-)
MVLRLIALRVAAAAVFCGGAAAKSARLYGSSSSMYGSSSSDDTAATTEESGGSSAWIITVLAGLASVCVLAWGAWFLVGSQTSDPRPDVDVETPKTRKVTLIVLDRKDGAALGLNIKKEKDHLWIKGIHESGLAADWNKAHPDAQLQVNDRIVEVSGAFDSGDALLAQCERHAVLRMTVLSGCEGVDIRPPRPVFAGTNTHFAVGLAAGGIGA